MLPHGWSFTCDLPITSLTRWPLFTDCTFRSGSNIKSPCRHSEFFTEVHRRILDRSCQYAVFPADSVLQAAIVFWCHHLSSDQPSVAVLSPLVPQMERPARRYNIFPVSMHLSVVFRTAYCSSYYALVLQFRHQLKTWLFKKSFRTSSSDTDCILTFNLGLSVQTLRRFCRLRSTIWYDIWTSRCNGIWETTRHNRHNGLLPSPTCYGFRQLYSPLNGRKDS